jgi:DNA-binding IclR family transcriptional regulator
MHSGQQNDLSSCGPAVPSGAPRGRAKTGFDLQGYDMKVQTKPKSQLDAGDSLLEVAATTVSKVRGGVQSVQVAATILMALASEGGALPLSRLALATGLPRAKVHRYLVSLRASGFVVQNLENGQYEIGPNAVTVGLVGLRRITPIRVIHEALPRLRDSIGETVTSAVWGNQGPTITAMEESSGVVTLNVRVGSILPILTSAIGRLFLTFLPSSVTDRLVAAERKAAGSGTPLISERELQESIRSTRRTGLCWAQPALFPGIDAVAAPVFDHRGTIVSAICVVAGSESLRVREEWIASTLTETCSEISRRLGYSAP